MECSGISKLWQAVYSTDTLIHILSRKTNARASRFYFLAQFLLRLILLQLISLLSLMEELKACNVYEKYLHVTGSKYEE